MAGDYTRFTHRPERDRSGVLMQQGRVQLDADWNELVEILNRRTRVESVDVIGRCGVPRETEHGFEIGGSSAEGLTIGVGRCYVDGLLAENRGDEREEWQHEPVWGEPVHASPTPYTEQPYLKPAPDPPTEAGSYLVYLDVWEREVGAAEDPDLVDAAVGVDTATRLQTVWAVRILAGAGECDPDWREFDETRPSGARLSNDTHGVSEPEDPCHVAPLGGYRGVDNRLYRVEIHDGGDQPSFKWSRDNASIATGAGPVEELGDGRVKVSVRSIGRDQELRFRDGDWVELLDDTCEPAGRPGVMARIAQEGVDKQANELTLESLSGAVIDGPNLRLRRWDQRDGVDAGRGTIPLDAAAAASAAGQSVELEDGIGLTFKLEAPGEFRVGDHWVFAARAGEEQGTIDPLTDEPPRGPRHHYCSLAKLEIGELDEFGEPHDCRVIYPPEPPPAVVEDGCACDVCVTPESHKGEDPTIQMAVDRVIEAGGGRVCLAAGRYELTEPVRIDGARSLTLSGKGAETQLFHGDRPGPALAVTDSIEVTIERLAIEALEDWDETGVGRTLIAVQDSLGTTVQRCALGASPYEQPAALFKQATDVADAVVLVQDRPTSGVAVGLAGLLMGTVIRENAMTTAVGVAALPALASGEESNLSAEGESDVPAYLATLGLWVEDNLIACGLAGVDLGFEVGEKAERPVLLVHCGETRIAGNAILGCEEVGVRVGGFIRPEGVPELDQDLPEWIALLRLYPVRFAAGIDGSRLEIVRNQVSVGGVGVRVGCDETRIAGNELTRVSREDRRRSAIEVVRGAAGERALRGLEIAGNRVRNFSGDGISIRCDLADAGVTGNTVHDVGRSALAVIAGEGSTPTLRVSGNELLDADGSGEGVSAAFVHVPGGRVTFAENHCRLVRDSAMPVAQLWLDSGALSATANHLSGGPKSHSMQIRIGSTSGRLPFATLLGNVGERPYEFNEQPVLPSPWRQLNLPN